MKAWWTNGKGETPETAPWVRAVTYYRHSAQDRQENSIPIQRELVGKWCQDARIEIIQEFADHGVSGLSTERRDAFNDMMENWVKKRADFQFVVVLDVSRWGRFQDIDLSAAYSSECTRHGKEVVYTNLGLPKKNDPLHSILVSLERYRAAQYSRDLSEKVYKGLAKISEQGFRAGASPPYGLCRILLNEKHEPIQVLKHGERKSLHNQRISLGPGDPAQISIVLRIFQEFADGKRHEREIAEDLNRDGIPSPRGTAWDLYKVRQILRNEHYIGTIIYNKSTQRLRSPLRTNPRDQWIFTRSAFRGIVPKDLYGRAQAIYAERRSRRTRKYLLDGLRRIYDLWGTVNLRLVRADQAVPTLPTYRKYFWNVDSAYQELHSDQRTEVVRDVRRKIEETVGRVEDYGDFLVLDRSLTVLVQPSVPVASGYGAYWYFRPDPRPVIDITLGVFLSAPEGGEPIGYLALPRLLNRHRMVRVFGRRDPRIDLFGHDDLSFLKELLK